MNWRIEDQGKGADRLERRHLNRQHTSCHQQSHKSDGIGDEHRMIEKMQVAPPEKEQPHKRH